MPSFILRGILALIIGSFIFPLYQSRAETPRPPNIVFILADDLGYGEVGCYCQRKIRTPSLDQLANEGIRFTQFYCGNAVCAPSRCVLLTGKHAGHAFVRDNRSIKPEGQTPIPADSVTIAKLLKKRGYATAAIGKWHLGHLPQFLPMRQGFDSYYGIPYSNDMKPTPLLRDAQVVEEPVQQATLTARYTAEAVSFIRQHREGPFFLYFAHTFPHVPLAASEKFKGKSRRGLYGDVVEELDWSVGQVLDTVRELDLEEQTFVFFTSDNGPWIEKNQEGGSAGLLRGGKGSTWEGGMREPAIAWWPGSVPEGETSAELACTTDLFATILALADVPLPTDRTLDSLDIRGMLLGTGESLRKSHLYYRGRQLMAARLGPWKAHFMTQAGYGQPKPEVHDPPLLFNLDKDPSEKYDVAGEHVDVIGEIRKLVSEHQAGLTAPPSQLDLR